MPTTQQQKIEAIRDHVRESKRQGRCLQCTYPWYDGLCECEDQTNWFGDIAEYAYELIAEGVDVEKEIKVRS